MSLSKGWPVLVVLDEAMLSNVCRFFEACVVIERNGSTREHAADSV